MARLAAIGESLDTIDAILLTHEHSDHVLGLPVIARTVGKPVYCTHLTAEVLDWERSAHRERRSRAGTGFTIGDIEIGSFTIPHDAVDPVGFTIRAGRRPGQCRDRSGLHAGLDQDAFARAPICCCWSRITTWKC